MNSSPAVLRLIPIAAMAFAIAHVAFEHVNGGVKTHHFLARQDLPGFSNWLGIIVLPLLAAILSVRIRRMSQADRPRDLPRSVALPFAGALLYGAVLAASFHFGASQISLIAFAGLFPCALALPVYRAEYILGFVVGMTATFGSVIPSVFALVFAALSFIARRVFRLLISACRSRGA